MLHAQSYLIGVKRLLKSMNMYAYDGACQASIFPKVWLVTFNHLSRYVLAKITAACALRYAKTEQYLKWLLEFTTIQILAPSGRQASVLFEWIMVRGYNCKVASIISRLGFPGLSKQRMSWGNTLNGFSFLTIDAKRPVSSRSSLPW